MKAVTVKTDADMTLRRTFVPKSISKIEIKSRKTNHFAFTALMILRNVVCINGMECETGENGNKPVCPFNIIEAVEG